MHHPPIPHPGNAQKCLVFNDPINQAEIKITQLAANNMSSDSLEDLEDRTSRDMRSLSLTHFPAEPSSADDACNGPHQ